MIEKKPEKQDGGKVVHFTGPQKRQIASIQRVEVWDEESRIAPYNKLLKRLRFNSTNKKALGPQPRA